MTISVIMSVYRNERPEYLDESIRSIWTDQTVKPAEIILIKDGPLTDALERTISTWKERRPVRPQTFRTADRLS